MAAKKLQPTISEEMSVGSIEQQTPVKCLIKDEVDPQIEKEDSLDTLNENNFEETTKFLSKYRWNFRLDDGNFKECNNNECQIMNYHRTLMIIEHFKYKMSRV